MKAKKVIGNIFFCLMLSCGALSIGYNIYSKQKAEKLHDEAVTVAQNYLKNKYGFDVDLSDDSEYPMRQNALLKQDIYEFSAKYNNKDFCVWVNKKSEDNVCCKDSFQLDEISSGIENLVKEYFPLSFLSYCWIGDTGDWGKYTDLYGGFADYYDGTNLKEIMDKNYGQIKVCVCDDTIENPEIYQKLSDLNIKYSFTNFDSKAHLNEFKEFNSDFQSDYEYLSYKYAIPYITEHIDNLSGTEKKLDVKLDHNGEFYYSYLPVENRGFPASESIDPPAKTDIEYFNGLFEFKGSEISEPYDEREYIDTPVSDPWQFNCRYGDVMVYYPLDKLNKYNIDDLGYAWYSHGGFSNNRNIDKLTVFGDYAVLRLQYADIKFMLVDMSGKDEYVPGWDK